MVSYKCSQGTEDMQLWNDPHVFISILLNTQFHCNNNKIVKTVICLQISLFTFRDLTIGKQYLSLL